MIHSIEPARITAGDSVAWTRTLPDYAGSGGWALTYVLVSGSARIDLAAVASDADYVVSVTPAVTALWPPGSYSWQAYVTKPAVVVDEVETEPAQRYRVDGGTLTIERNLAAAQLAGFDSRSFAQQMVDAIEAKMQNRATRGQLDLISKNIKDWSLQRDPAHLIKLRDQFRWEIKNERDREKIANGEHNPRYIQTRMGRW